MMMPDEYQRMASLEREHWWYRSLHQMVLRTLRRHFGDKDVAILDAGCGTGGLMDQLKQAGYTNVKGFDLSEEAVRICQQKGHNVVQGDLKQVGNNFPANSADVIISNDTFYFLNKEEQIGLADAFNRILKAGGLLIVNMPSMEAFRGNHDLQVGVRERFNKSEVPKIFKRKIFRLLQQTYWPFALSPAIWWIRKQQRMQQEVNAPASDLKKEPWLLNSALYYITNIENTMLSSKPFGSSLFLVLQKVV